MKKVNIVIIVLTILSISIETARGNYPWIITKGNVFQKAEPNKPPPNVHSIDKNSNDTTSVANQKENDTSIENSL